MLIAITVNHFTPREGDCLEKSGCKIFKRLKIHLTDRASHSWALFLCYELSKLVRYTYAQ